MTSKNAYPSESFVGHIMANSTDVVAHPSQAPTPRPLSDINTPGHVAEPPFWPDADHENAMSYKIVGSSTDSSKPDSVGSEKRGCSSPRESWRTRTMQIGPVKRIMSVVAPAYADSIATAGNSSEKRRPWRPTFIRWGPLLGISSMLLAVASLIASFGILAGSNGQAVADWSAPPATYLAIFTAIANLSMRYAALQGVVIAWWLRASNGSTLAKLHWDWRSGTTIRGALTAGRHMGLLGLACIFSTVVVVDGPLLQRSSTVISAPITNQAVSLNVSMVPELPSGFAGTWAPLPPDSGLRFSLAFNDSVPTNNGSMPQNFWPDGNATLLPAIGDWWGSTALTGVVRGCPNSSVCETTIKAPALWPTVCTTHSVPVDFKSHLKHVNEILVNKYASPLNHDSFIIDTTILLDEREAISLITGYFDSTDCDGTLNYTICTLESAIGEYNVTIRDHNIDMDSLAEPRLVALANNTAVNHTWDPAMGGYPSTFAGYATSIYVKWSSYIFYSRNKDGSAQIATMGSAESQQFMVPASINKRGSCPNYRDPHKSVLAAFNRLMLYAGAFLAKETANEGHIDVPELMAHMDPGLEVNYTTIGYIRGDHNIYSTDYHYFAGAAIVELICIALILPTYWGWWKIGRPVSFSPLELAKAFESPMLSDWNSNSSGRDLAKATSDFNVRYGMMRSNSTSGNVKIAFGDPTSVNAPQKGMRFDI